MSRTNIVDYPEKEFGQVGSKERRKNLQRHTTLVQYYGITLKAYRNMLEAQNYLCSICHQPETGTHNRGKETIALSLSVDHDHDTGAVRSLLCHKCNKALGLFNDDIEMLRSALEYLEQHKAGG